METQLDEIIEKLEIIIYESRKQSKFLVEDNSKLDLSILMDNAIEMEQIMLNPRLAAPKNYPKIIADFVPTNPLTVKTLEDLEKISKEFIEFLKK